MIEITNKSDCTGCHACYNICPRHCIEMKADEEGFLYPIIDKERCIRCGMCVHICPMREKTALLETPQLYYGWVCDEQLRRKSSSGGIFSVLAEWILSHDGVVYGAGYDNDLMVMHKRITTLDEVEKLRGSKYVQSSVGDTFGQVKEDLENKTWVYYSGTPCQIAGLRNYLGKEYDNLICQDIICHGVPSPKVWKMYIDACGRRNGAAVIKADFRNKSGGWTGYRMMLKFQNGKEYKVRHDKNLYMKLFLKNVILRSTCYSCHYKEDRRISDIALADFWGVQKIFPQLFDDKGISLILINSEKGERLLNSIKGKKVEIYPLQRNILDEGYNSSARYSAQPHTNRGLFFEELEKDGIIGAAEKALKEKINIAIIRREMIAYLVRVKRQLLKVRNIFFNKKKRRMRK